MARRLLLTSMLIAPLALAACTGDEKADDQAAANASNVASNATAPANAANATAPAPAPDAFSRYVGHYPFDKVGAHSWHDDPLVVKAVEKTVSDKAVRKWVLEDAGPATPIAMVGGRVASWACEAHNCGPHQWVTLVDPRDGATEICYFDESVAPEKTRWFRDGKEEERPGKCPEVEG
ncbi:hypothetical protein DM806_14075 [Sphingobium lactosutens]|uniref:hypothetical protein n=1 Tax=Sphingobium lactosutens TaxID=522773 RepID=UPI0015BDFD0C|nr:hypothetical protein [Sphingobium lactosutens]NWK96768.1 hypothetical protein [Sphingobium lactosutens]